MNGWSDLVGVSSPGGGSVSGGIPDEIILRHVETQNTDGGAVATGSWQDWEINEETLDTGAHCSLSANVFTLQPGVYSLEAYKFFIYGQRTKVRLYNVTDASAEDLGDSTYNNSNNAASAAKVFTRLVLTEATEFKLQYQAEAASGGNGLGVATNFAQEIYAQVRLFRWGDVPEG